MIEQYNLPVLFTEEERRRYAEWGIKKSKIFMPFCVIVILMNFLVIVGTFLYFLKARDRFSPFSLYLYTRGKIVSGFSYGIATLLPFLILKPLEWIFDKIFKKPKDPKMLCLKPTIKGVQYELIRKNNVLLKGILSWEEWKTVVYPDTNQIWIQDQCLEIQANTIETIYPQNYRRKWMDYPEEKIIGTINLGKIQKNMEGYLASLEEQKREKEWQEQMKMRDELDR